jgi:hypothetical protein
MSPSSVDDDEHIDAMDEIRLPRNRDEPPVPPAEPTPATRHQIRTEPQAPFLRAEKAGGYFSEIIEGRVREGQSLNHER